MFFSKPGYVLAYPVVVLAEIQLELLLRGPEVKVIEVFGYAIKNRGQ
jgi:hypothetical protein